MKIHGILTLEDADKSGETLIVGGADLDPLRMRGYLRIEAALREPENSLSGVIGSVTAAHVVLDPATEPDEELRELAGGKPFIKVEALLNTKLRGPHRPPGAYGREVAEALQQVPPLAFYFGVSGSVLQKSADGKTLEKTVIREVILTQLGVHRAQRVIPGPLKGC